MQEPNWDDRTSVDKFLKELATKTTADASKKAGEEKDYYACTAGLYGAVLLSLLSKTFTVDDMRKILLKQLKE